MSSSRFLCTPRASLPARTARSAATAYSSSSSRVSPSGISGGDVRSAASTPLTDSPKKHRSTRVSSAVKVDGDMYKSCDAFDGSEFLDSHNAYLYLLSSVLIPQGRFFPTRPPSAPRVSSIV
jgi:hypothetical protein